MHTHQKRSAAVPSRPPAPTKTPQPPAEKAPTRSVTADDIRQCAYRKWEAAGKPAGDGVRFWLEAEQELVHGM